MKICVVTGTFHPEPGGPSTYLYNLLGDLVQRGHEVAVITYGDLEEEYDYPYPVIRISRRRPIPVRLIKFVYYILSIGRRYDLLFVNNYGLPAVVANACLRKPVAMKLVGDFAWEYSIRHGLIDKNEGIDEFQRKGRSLKVELLKRLQLFYTSKADAVIAPSQYFKGIISGWGIPYDKIEVIYNAIDPSRYALACTKEEARGRLGLEGKIILTVARLTPWKGIDRIIEVLPEIRRRINEANLVVVGDGPELGNLQGLARELGVKGHVSFVGRVPHEEVPYYLRAADVFVLYSGYEGLPHIVLEAMATGVPVILSDKGGNQEVVEDGVNGLLVPIGNQEKLKEAILRVLQNREMAGEFVERSRERLEQAFSWDVLTKRTLEVLQAMSDKALLSC
ncbi:MAG: glycosyltransferase family 4 protein [Anaerolineae bacterium]